MNYCSGEGVQVLSRIHRKSRVGYASRYKGFCVSGHKFPDWRTDRPESGGFVVGSGYTQKSVICIWYIEKTELSSGFS